MRALVTGGAGFIGAALVRRLLAEGASVQVVDDGSSAGFSRLASLTKGEGRLELAEIDVRSPRLTAVVEHAAPEVVFHLAAQVNVHKSLADARHDASVNLDGTLAVLEAARLLKRPARVVLAASGGSLYGPEHALSFPVAETAPRGPVSPYGLSKRVAIEYLELYRRLYGLEGCALAPANVYGPSQELGSESAVVAAFVEALVAGEDLVVYGDGGQTRDLVFVDDVADGFWRAGVLEHAGVGPVLYNLGTGVETSINELAEHLRAIAGSDVAIRHAPGRPGEVRRSALDASLAGRVLGWRARTGLEEGLRATFEHRRARARQAS
jgi:UDP-glucose 4-epimerase